MSAHAWLLLSWVLVGAAVLVAHAVVVAQALCARQLDWRFRLAALVPPIAPFVAWYGGRRVAPIAELVLIVVYATLRALE